MKKAILIGFFLFLLYGFGQIAKASYDDGAGLDYVPPNQNLGIHTMTVPEALTLNGNFALKDQGGAASNTNGYGKLYNNNGDLYYQNGSSIFMVNNGNLGAEAISADSLDFSEFKDAMTLDATTTVSMGSYDLNFDSDTLVINGSASNVGIGVSSPEDTLQIDGSLKVGLRNPVTEGQILVVAGDNVLNPGTLGFSSRYNVLAAGLKSYGDGGIYARDLRFYTNTTAADANPGGEVARFDFNGNFGIGTASPTNTLQVNGDLQVTESIVFDAEDEIASAATITINWNNGNKQFISLANDNNTIQFNKFTSDKVANVSLTIIQNGGNMDVSTWAGVEANVDIKWPGGTAPDLSDGDNDIDVINCLYHVNGHNGNGEFLCTPSFDFLE